MNEDQEMNGTPENGKLTFTPEQQRLMRVMRLAHAAQLSEQRTRDLRERLQQLHLERLRANLHVGRMAQELGAIISVITEEAIERSEGQSAQSEARDAILQDFSSAIEEAQKVRDALLRIYEEIDQYALL